MKMKSPIAIPSDQANPNTNNINTMSKRITRSFPRKQNPSEDYISKEKPNNKQDQKKI